MKPNPVIAAMRKLAHMGYRFTVNGEIIKAKYEAPGKPDPAEVRHLLALVKEYKEEAISYLARKPQAPERILTCFECDHFRPAANSPNPAHGWGRCEKRNKGRYGVAMGCEVLVGLNLVLEEVRQ